MSYRLISDGLWVAIGQVLSAVAMIVSIRVLTEFLVPADYGVMALVLATASTILSLAIGVVGEGILVNYSRFAGADGGATFRKATAHFSLLVCGIVIAATLSFGVVLTSTTEIHWLLPLLVVGVIAVDSARYFELMLFTAARRQRTAAIVHVGDAWLRLGSSWLALVVFHADAYVAIGGNLVGGIILLVIIRLTLRPVGVGGTVTGDAGRISEIQSELKRLFPTLMPAKLLANIADIGNRYAIAMILGLAGAGIYSACYGLARRPFGMLNSISDWTMKPVLAQTLASQDKVGAFRIRFRWAASVAAVSLAGVILIYLLREPVVFLLLGEGYREAIDIMPIMAIGVGIFTAANVLNSIMIVEGRPKAVLHSNLAGTTISFTTTVLFSWLFGLQGAAWAIVAGYLAFGAASCAGYRIGARGDLARRLENDQ